MKQGTLYTYNLFIAFTCINTNGTIDFIPSYAKNESLAISLSLK